MIDISSIAKIRPNLNKVATPDFKGLCSADSYPILTNNKCRKRIFGICIKIRILFELYFKL